MKALACPMLAHEFLNTGEKAPLLTLSGHSRNQSSHTGDSPLWYNIGFGLGLAFSLTPGRHDRDKG